MTTLRQALDAGTARLSAAGVPSPRVDAELLLGHLLRLGRGQLAVRLHLDHGLEAATLAEFEAMLQRRADREPLQHITGVAHFRELELRVGPGVFVPRPETELLAQLAIDALLTVPDPQPVAVDLGTGSGAIAIAVATEVPQAAVTAVEVSPDAFVWAVHNARDADAANLRVVLGDLREAVPELDGRAHVVVSNPPYIPTGAVPRDPEVRLHDPELALYSGADGLELIRELSHRARRLLVPGGFLAIEHGEQHAAAVRELLAADGWRAVAGHPDLLGRPRFTTALRA